MHDQSNHMIRRYAMVLGSTVAAFAGGCSERAGPVSGTGPGREPKIAALIDHLKSQGLELRPVENHSNVIEYIFSVAPGVESENQVGFSYWPGPHRPNERVTDHAITIPYEVHGDWVLWRVGGSRGNASEDYIACWERVRSATSTYGEHESAARRGSR